MLALSPLGLHLLGYCIPYVYLRSRADPDILSIDVTNTTTKQIFHPASIFAFSPGIFVFGTKGAISFGCILKQGYKVPAPSVWRWLDPPTGNKSLLRLEAPAGTALGYNRDKIFLDKII